MVHLVIITYFRRMWRCFCLVAQMGPSVTVSTIVIIMVGWWRLKCLAGLYSVAVEVGKSGFEFWKLVEGLDRERFHKVVLESVYQETMDGSSISSCCLYLYGSGWISKVMEFAAIKLVV
ncbi:hypothetical protein M8C21_030227, partial [Ambrosia artemisiifolia]